MQGASPPPLGLPAAGGLASTSWPMVGHDLRHSGMSATTGPKAYKVAWSLGICGGAYQISAVVGAHGEIYIACGDLYSIRPTGTVAWHTKIGTGGCTTPAVSTSGLVYEGGCNGVFYAVTSGGAIKWTYPTSGEIESSPAVTSSGTILFGDDNGYLYALSSSGHLMWKFSAGTALASSPAVSGSGIIYIGGSNGYLYAVKSTGTLDWKFLTVSGGSVTTPAIGPSGIIYVTVLGGALYAITAGGTLQWQFSPNDQLNAPPAVNEKTGVVYVVSSDLCLLYAVSSLGKQQWTYATGGCFYAAVSIGSDGTIYVSSDDGSSLDTLAAVSPSGTQLWINGPDFSESTPVIGATGTLYVSFDSGFYAIT